MARIRTLKPEFWTDEKLALMPPLTRLVFLGIISQADDAGRLVDNVKLIDGLLFPYTEDTCAEALDDLYRIGRVLRYRSESGQPLLQVVNWEKHQKVTHASRYVLPPPPSAPKCDPQESLTRVSGESHEDLTRVSGSDQQPTTYDQLPTTSNHAAPEAPEASDGGEVEQDDKGHKAECVAFVKSAGYGPREALIAQGEDATAWNDASGQRVPWKDRLRLLRLADARVKDRSSANLRSALRYVIPQQYHPYVAPLPGERPPPQRQPPTAQVGAAAPTLPSVGDLERKRESAEQRYAEWKAQILGQLKLEPEDVWESLRVEAVGAIGELAFKAMPKAAHPRLIEAKVLEIYGERMGNPQPKQAA